MTHTHNVHCATKVVVTERDGITTHSAEFACQDEERCGCCGALTIGPTDDFDGYYCEGCGLTSDDPRENGHGNPGGRCLVHGGSWR